MRKGPATRIVNVCVMASVAAWTAACGGASTATPTEPTTTAASSAKPVDQAALDKQRHERSRYGQKLHYEKTLGTCRSTKTRVTDRRIEFDGAIEFELDSDALTDESGPTLQALKQTLVDNPGLDRVEVAGHADSTGEDAHNLDLTRRRADAVRTWLVKRGVAPARLVSMGYSSYCPKNASDPTDAKNRRVELAIVQRDGKAVDPGWGGCEAAEKKGLKKPTATTSSTPATPPKTKPGDVWQAGQKLPDKLCGEPFEAAPVTWKELYVPIWERPTEVSRGVDDLILAESIRNRLVSLCDPKTANPDVVRSRLASSLLVYAGTQSDVALRDDAFAHAVSLMKRQRARFGPKGGRPLDEECLLEAEVSVRRGDLGFVQPLVECFEQGQHAATSAVHIAWFALDVAEAQHVKLDLSPLERYLDSDLARNVSKALAARMKTLAGGDADSVFELWNDAVDASVCPQGPGRWVLAFAPEYPSE